MNLDELQLYAEESNAEVIVERGTLLKLIAVAKAAQADVDRDITPRGVIPELDALREALQALTKP